MHTRHLLLLKPSRIPGAGVGCFAASTIASGSRLTEIGVKNRHLALENIPDVYLKYCVLLSSGNFLAPEDFTQMSALWYINHSKEPNIEFKDGKLHARSEIIPGTELTLYYSDLLTHPKNAEWVRPEHI